MPKNEDGEFELVMGNRQLMSVFFIVVLLLCVFFIMGWIMGKNSTSGALADVTPVKPTDGKPLVIDSSPALRDPPPTTSYEPSRPVETKAALPKENPPLEKAEPPKAQPVKEPAKKEEPKKVAVKKEEPKKEPVKKEPAKKEPAKKEPAKEAGKSGAPPAGTYWQIAAIPQPQAGVMLDVLKRKNFKAITAEVPEKPGLFRVLVGPLAEGTTIKVRTDLEAAGFRNSIKKTF